MLQEGIWQMIRITQLKMKLNHTEEELKNLIRKSLKTSCDFTYKIVKQSIDARKDEVKYIYTVDVYINNEKQILRRVNDKNIMLTKEGKYTFPVFGNTKMKYRPVVVGSGPAGLFCGYMLAISGYRPIVIERGEAVDDRIKTVDNFFKTGILNTESNVQFGEGGAGTFSDGKLNTLVKDKFHRNDYVLETFVKFGGDEKIKYVNKPHIGTDILSEIVKNIRNEAIKYGAEFMFNTKMTQCNIKENTVDSIDVINNGVIRNIPCDNLVLAIGHSSRDTFEMLYKLKINMEPKAFAVGVRIEHPQDMISESQYGKYKDKLEAAAYKLATKVESGRSVYTFCMCPGGYVVNSSSEEKHTAVNGMSYSKRDGKNANTAMIVNVTPEDFGSDSPLAGIEFQRKLEKAAYNCGEGKIPVQLFGDFRNNKQTKILGDVEPQMKGDYTFSNLREIFPEYISESLISGIDYFSTKIKNYNRDDAVLSGVESRTSSPLRIPRDEGFESSIKGIYPCGEGAGYAGGITSAAMDGIKVFEIIAKKYAPLTSS